MKETVRPEHGIVDANAEKVKLKSEKEVRGFVCAKFDSYNVF